MNDAETAPNHMSSTMQVVDTTHEDMIHDAQMDFYGMRLATCSSDKSIRIFEVSSESYKLLQTLNGHNGPVWQVAWVHPSYGTILASCSYDRTVVIWKEKDGLFEKNYTYGDHDSSVNSLSWAPYQYGLILACGSSDGAISILTGSGDSQWSAKKISNAHTIGCNAVSWEPAGASLSILNIRNTDSGFKEDQIKRFASGGCDNLIKIWKLNEDDEWIEEQKLEGHSDWVRDVAWAPSLGLTDNMIASCSQDRRVIVWTAEIVGEDDQREERWTPKTLCVFDDVVWHVSWSVTGNNLAVSGGDNKVSLWKQSYDGHWSCSNEINRGVTASSSSSKSASKIKTKVESKSDSYKPHDPVVPRKGGHSSSTNTAANQEAKNDSATAKSVHTES